METYVNEMAAFDRAGKQNISWNMTDPIEKFKEHISRNVNQLRDRGLEIGGNIADDNTILYLQNSISNIGTNAAYMNPTAYVLGYIATNSGKEALTHERLQNAVTAMNIIDNSHVSVVDIIRYARLWISRMVKH